MKTTSYQKSQRLEDLPAWQETVGLFEAVDDLFAKAPSPMSATYRAELERTVLSISNLVAQGYELIGRKEFSEAIFQARCATGTIKALTLLVAKRKWAQTLKAELAAVKDAAIRTSDALMFWEQSFFESGTKATPEHAARRKDLHKKLAVAFKNSLLANLPPDHPARRAAEKVQAESVKRK